MTHLTVFHVKSALGLLIVNNSLTSLPMIRFPTVDMIPCPAMCTVMSRAIAKLNGNILKNTSMLTLRLLWIDKESGMGGL